MRYSCPFLPLVEEKHSQSFALFAGASLLVASLVGACSVGGQTGDEFGSVIQRIEGDSPRIAAEGPKRGAASEEMAAFAWGFYGSVANPNENFVYSPYSLATAASMLYAGAEGQTQSEMAEVFHFSEEGDAFHASRNDLLHFLSARNRKETEDQKEQILKSSNDFWMAQGFSVKDDFLNTLSAYYGAPVHLFDGAPEDIRRAINSKVSQDTNELIPELLPKKSIDETTAFVLTNALYFKARWVKAFPDYTDKADFFAQDGSVAEVDMMYGPESYLDYALVEGISILSMPYSGDELEFVAMMPSEGEFDSFVGNLSPDRISELSAGLSTEPLLLYFPKMDIDFTLDLKKELTDAGMIEAFDDGAANFASLTDEALYLSNAFHQTKLVLDEEGTEAAAATAFVGSTTSSGPTRTEVRFNRPFVFFIRDVETQAVLFLGHFSNPE